MINFPPNRPIDRPADSGLNRRTRRAAPSSATVKRESTAVDRRGLRDRRSRKGAQQVIDRRTGAERRRASIDFSV